MGPVTKKTSQDAFITRIITAAKARAPNLSATIDTFIRLYYAGVSAEDLREHDPEALAGSALAHFQLGNTRGDKRFVLRIFNPTSARDGWRGTHTIIQTVATDVPFLVDSASLCIQRHHLTIHQTIYPVLRLKRNSRGILVKIDAQGESGSNLNESFIHIEVSKISDPDQLGSLTRDLGSAFRDVIAAVNDWTLMRGKATSIAAKLSPDTLPLDPDEIEEGRQFLNWLVDNNFTFLGYREYRLETQGQKPALAQVPGTGLGILRESDKESKPLLLPSALRKRALTAEFAIITKANSHSTVHRPAYLDYIGIKRYNQQGHICGEYRFLGLFTSPVYIHSPLEIPIVRRKIHNVLERTGYAPSGHAGKSAAQVLQTLPRDELFQANEQELFNITAGILQMQERSQVRLFIRHDTFGRFYSCLIYVPRDRYNSGVREHMQTILGEALRAQEIETFIHMDESILARIHMILHTRPWQHSRIGHKKLERELAEATRTWADALRVSLIKRHGERRGIEIFNTWGGFIPVAYQGDVTPDKAPHDIHYLERLGETNPLDICLYRSGNSPESVFRIKIFSREQPVVVSDALPLLENMGMRVIAERPYLIELEDASVYWIHDFEILTRAANPIQAKNDPERFREAFLAIWRGDTENDGLNNLILEAGMNWTQIWIIRAYEKYLLQTGMPFGERYVEQILSKNPAISRLAVELFEARFDPLIATPPREEKVKVINQALDRKLDQLSGQDEDRILRALVGFIRASLRTNYFIRSHRGKYNPYLSFKLDSKQIQELPLPKPMYEIFVYAPHVEGIHLRGGKIARGGLRWSDRKADYRTEVLGLMKAQTVKNTVIVPVGAKGGFIAKRLPTDGDRDATLTEVKHCYRDFIRGLLDITDNIINDKVIHPDRVVRYDDDDPYLVVAADKGTATFSDLANEIAADYGFWLGDAFASGGSVGYDHKQLAITAKGAWVSARRLFGELGTNPETDEISAIGIGDMSGDVFGNGMLLSRTIKLRAAFDHHHIFIDPNPDTELSYKERERLFHLERSSWADYDQEILSAGGGIYPRSAKYIQVSKQARKALGLTKFKYRPQELIHEILQAPVDLFWNGGIGTYIKASSESHLDVGDRTNDAVRINGKDLRCKIAIEGGNLGITQLGRIEYALHGGRVTTDFIDNSAGVDCSDHEVNIKIFLNQLNLRGKIREPERRKLLADMTPQITEIVLRDNYLKALALSVAEAQSQNQINEHAHLLRTLEQKGTLDRKLEYLPSEDEIIERRAGKQGFTRPELAVLLAYAKITVKNALNLNELAADEYLSRELIDYFPVLLRPRFLKRSTEHPLRNAIIGTAITNSMINRMGFNFPFWIQETTGASISTVARAYTIARESLNMPEFWRGLEVLPINSHSRVQSNLITLSDHLVRYATRWLIEHGYGNADILKTVKKFNPVTKELLNLLPDILPERSQKQYRETCAVYADDIIPEKIQRLAAAIPALYTIFDIHMVAEKTGKGIGNAAKAYFHLGSVLGLDWFKEQIESLPTDDHWKTLSRATLRERLYAQQRRLTIDTLTGTDIKEGVIQQVENWVAKKAAPIQHFLAITTEIKNTGQIEFASMSVALEEAYAIQKRSMK